MSLPWHARLARRELRGGLAGFRILLICLALGVAAIAAVGSVRAAIEAGLARAGRRRSSAATREVSLTYRFAEPAERAWLEDRSTTRLGNRRFPLDGRGGRGRDAERALTPGQGRRRRLAAGRRGGARPADAACRGARPHAIGPAGRGHGPAADDRLGLAPGDIFRLGAQDFRLTAALTREPDAGAAGFGLGPRTLSCATRWRTAGLLGAGTLFDSRYRLMLPAGHRPRRDAATLARAPSPTAARAGATAAAARPASTASSTASAPSWCWSGLTGLAVGGVGVSAAVRAYLAAQDRGHRHRSRRSAPRGGTIFRVYLIQIGAAGRCWASPPG